MLVHMGEKEVQAKVDGTGEQSRERWLEGQGSLLPRE